jgi:hypothetical protein
VSVSVPSERFHIVRVQYLTLAAAGAALLAPTAPPAPTTLPATATATEPIAHGGPMALHEDGEVSAADLLAKVRECAPVSHGRYRSDAFAPPTIPVCGTRDAVYWQADMDIDCDGRPGPRCNRSTDPLFSDATAFQQSDGRYLSAERLPYVVVPAPSRIWDYRASGIHGGSVVAVVHSDRVRYAVVGDVGPYDVIGEASYATAASLGIRPDPHGGGTDSGVTYNVFRDARVTPIEGQVGAVTTGERLAREFVRGE